MLLEFNAHQFILAITKLEELRTVIDRNDETLDQGPLRDRFTQQLRDGFRAVKGACEQIGLPVCMRQIQRIDQLGQSGQMTFGELRECLVTLKQTFIDELSDRQVYCVSSDMGGFYEPDPATNHQSLRLKGVSVLYGAEITRAFPSVEDELNEAVRCLIVGRGTASVFHVMRALETPLNLLAVAVNVQADRTNWQSLLDQIEKKVNGMGSDSARLSDWKTKQEFYSSAISSFRVFKNAWRNHTMHARVKYSPDEADQIKKNVVFFLRSLASQLHE